MVVIEDMTAHITDIIQQLIALCREHADTGESDEDLMEHFLMDMALNEIVWVENMDGRIVGFTDFVWVQTPEDMAEADKGESTHGEVLYIQTLVSPKLGILREIKKLLPTYKYIVGMHEGHIHAPKGWPDETVTQAA